MTRPSLRSLLLVPLAVLLASGALALGIFVERSVTGDLIAGVDDELARVAAFARGQARRPGSPPGAPATDAEPPPSIDVTGSEAPLEYLIGENGVTAVQQRDGSEIADATLLELVGTIGTRTLEGTPRYRAVASPTADGQTRVVALSLEQVDASLRSLHRNLIAGGLALLAVQMLAIWFIAGAVARPVTRMSNVAHNIAGGDLDATVGPARGSRETADLATDLTQMLQRLNVTISEQQQSAADANQARADMQRFMADASHELRTPLTALKGYSDLYQRGMLDGEGVDRAMGRIGSESERMTDLVLGLLDLMRTDNGHSFVAIDLHAAAQRVVEDAAAAFPARTIQIARGTNAEALTVSGDPDRMHQAILNLVANACQHTEPPCPIEVTIEADRTNVRVLVIDHGSGIDQHDAEQLFVAFARGDESRSRQRHDGAGLGLALVRRIAEQHGGSAWVNETPGGGATFGITVPRAAASAHPPI